MNGQHVTSVGQVIADSRLEAAQAEWERARRVVVTQAVGIRQSCLDLRHIVARLDVNRADERDLLRHIENISACIAEMDGENWLKSPLAMAALRAKENGAQ